MSEAEDDADDPFTFENRCVIEARWPQIANAFDLPMDEFISRLIQAREMNAEQSGAFDDPLNAHLHQMERQMRQWAKKKRK